MLGIKSDIKYLMNVKLTQMVLAVVVSMSTGSIVAADATGSPEASAAVTSFTGLSQADAVRKAAEMVANAAEVDRQQVALSVVREVVRSHTYALPELTRVIATKYPELAGAVVGEAVRLHPDEAAVIVAGVVKQLPQQSGTVVESVLIQNPSMYQTVGLAAMDAAPDKTAAILRSISLVCLELKPMIDQVLPTNP